MTPDDSQEPRALSPTERLRQAGTQEQYLESSFLVEALELELTGLMSSERGSGDEHS